MNVTVAPVKDKRNLYRRLYGLLTMLILASIVIAGIHMRSARFEARWKGLPTPTWDGVPAMLYAAAQSEEYKQAGEHLSDPQLSATDSTDKKTAYAHRVVVDFLRTLSPKQVQIISRQPLTLNQLRPDQKKLLLMLAALPGKQGLANLSDESGIFMCSFPAKFNQGTFLFCWVLPPHPQKHDWTGFWMSLTADGKTGFFQGVEPD